MGFLEAIILAIVQGLTEFLPVSSSGHLELVGTLFNQNAIPEENLTYTVVLHFATSISTLIVFRKEILSIIKGLFSTTLNDEKVFSIKIIISMIPAVFVGLVFEEQIERLFSQNLFLVGMSLIFTAFLLYLSEKLKPTSTTPLSYFSSFLIGVSQAIAILPGVSRSGSTIATALLLKIDKQKAAQFSFLMVIPLIFGKIAKDLLSGEIIFTSSEFLPMLLGFVVAICVGILACSWMLKIVRSSKLTYFAIYCLIVGVLSIVFHYA